MPDSRDNKTRRIGLIGNPIGHSLSPSLFREYFAGQPDILSSYSYELVERDSFDEAYSAFMKDFLAVNVTAPFKEDAFRAASCADRSAEVCLASNLLVKRSEGNGVKVWAYNTDFIAVREILEEECAEYICKTGNLNGRKALVVGCGGAGKAAAAAAAAAGMAVCICNRTVGKAEKFSAHLNACFGCCSEAVGLENLASAVRNADAVICSLPEAVAGLDRMLEDKLVIEASYRNPSLSDAICRHYVSGLVWLRRQALATYGIIPIV